MEVFKIVADHYLELQQTQWHIYLLHLFWCFRKRHQPFVCLLKHAVLKSFNLALHLQGIPVSYQKYTEYLLEVDLASSFILWLHRIALSPSSEFKFFIHCFTPISCSVSRTPSYPPFVFFLFYFFFSVFDLSCCSSH